MSIKNIKFFIKQINSRKYEDTEKIFSELNELKKEYSKNNDQEKAKEIWILETILKIQIQYLDAYSMIKAEKYYDAWCVLEQCDISLCSLRKHYELDENDTFSINFIDTHIKRYQSIFPYKIFMSPEIIILEECSICKKKISIRNPCGHVKGEIYNGQECYYIVTNLKYISTSFVEEPSGKYRVPFQVDPKTNKSIDHYNYSLLRYLIARLQSPFDKWSYKITKKRHPHSKFNCFGRNDKCPCGSGKKYKYCCLNEEGVLRPHYKFNLSVPPPPELITTEYTY